MMIKKFHFGHGVALALLAFIFFILGLILNFYKSSSDALSELVTDDYYQEELDYQNTIDAKKNAFTLAQPPVLSIEQPHILVQFPWELDRDLLQGRFHLYRPNDRRLDVKSTLQINAKNQLLIPRSLLKQGGYILKVFWEYQGKNFQLDFDVVWK